MLGALYVNIQMHIHSQRRVMKGDTAYIGVITVLEMETTRAIRFGYVVDVVT